MSGLMRDPMTRKRCAQVGNFVLLHALWLAAVFGAASGTNAWAASVLVVMLLFGMMFSRHRRSDVVMVFAGVFVGVIFESLLIHSKLIEYKLMLHEDLPPLWILALWMGFSQSFNYSLRWLMPRPVLAAVLGAVMSVISVLSGIHIGAADSPYPILLAVVYGAVWACVVPLLAVTARRLSRDEDGYGQI
ncbi:MAG: DUF2878 domain-containing protein [Gammaproteobacteria bacterium]|jgi:hypothetical protein|nr:DUF2878 domain-containing protein [Gammaproteobacteria bacterium]MBQ0773079.1 DUF2878 domain-containing protein [Gammaproteobacteria bacterium]